MAIKQKNFEKTKFHEKCLQQFHSNVTEHKKYKNLLKWINDNINDSIMLEYLFKSTLLNFFLTEGLSNDKDEEIDIETDTSASDLDEKWKLVLFVLELSLHLTYKTEVNDGELNKEFELNDVFPFYLMEECLDYSTIEEIEFLLDGFLFKHFHILLQKDFKPNKGKALILLKIFNEILRRISKSKNSEISGKLLTYLSNLYPISERSGVNAMGKFHTDNTTPYQQDHSTEGATISYGVFWECQKYFSDPLSLLKKDDIDLNIRQNIEKVVLGISQLLSDELNSKWSREKRVKLEKYYPKFLTFPSLFELLLNDYQFQLTILGQFLIFFNFLLSKDLSESQKKWALTGRKKCFELTQKLSPQIANNWKLLLEKHESNWIQWKKESCPPIEKPKMTFNFNQIDKEQSNWSALLPNLNSLSTLWENSELLMHEEKVHSLLESESLKVPELETFLEPLREQLNPEDEIEKDYRLSRDDVYKFLVMRMLTKQYLTEVSELEFEDQLDLEKVLFSTLFEDLKEEIDAYHEQRERERMELEKDGVEPMQIDS